MKKLIFVSLTLTVTVYTGCKKQLPAPTPVLLPLQLGNWWLYTVDSIIYTIEGLDSVKYLLKWKVVEQFTDQLGNPVYRIERQLKPADTPYAPWKSISSIFFIQQPTRTIMQTENVRLIVISTPVQVGVSWKGLIEYTPEEDAIELWITILNRMKNWDFYYSKTAYDCALGKCYQVVWNMSDLGIEQDTFYEVYAENIGLVERTGIYYERDSVNGPIKRGLYYRLRLVDYGVQ